MRVYIPATFDMLRTLAEDQQMPVRSGVGFALTPAVREYYTGGDEEELAYTAFLDAARASLRLLSIGDKQRFPHRRVPEFCRPRASDAPPRRRAQRHLLARGQEGAGFRS